MKANAPEKIYLDEDESWHLTNPNGDSVEYTRTDAFIEKAREWLRTNLSNYFDDTRETFELFVDDFVKFIRE